MPRRRIARWRQSFSRGPRKSWHRSGAPPRWSIKLLPVANNIGDEERTTLRHGQRVPRVAGSQLAKAAGQTGSSAELQSIGCADSEQDMEKKSMDPQLIGHIYEC